MDSLRNGDSSDVSLWTKALFFSALASLSLLLASESAKDPTGQNGYNVFAGGTSGLVDREAAKNKKPQGWHAGYSFDGK